MEWDLENEGSACIDMVFDDSMKAGKLEVPLPCLPLKRKLFLFFFLSNISV